MLISFLWRFPLPAADSFLIYLRSPAQGRRNSSVSLSVPYLLKLCMTAADSFSRSAPGAVAVEIDQAAGLDDFSLIFGHVLNIEIDLLSLSVFNDIGLDV